ncbi:hypothetical protein [Amycolatopsis coloradensis]|uniref:hypothetical protein n=1 Tax=Amycolatopsis coloradensis TaxID=76021 RepID=UPI001178791E|nr:hypothetical protein [Amycolatopsis coloradensis]
MAGITDRLAESWDDFIVALRSNEGFQKAYYEKLVEVLREAAREWSNADAIPRLAANVLVDIVPVTQSAADAYKEPVRQQIYDAGHELYDLVIDCVAVNPD